MTELKFANCRLFELPVLGDERGSLIAIEGGEQVPFDIARIYYIFGTKAGVSRGFHAHRRLRQWAICISGECTIILDTGQERRSFRLDRPMLALEIGSQIWREMVDFSDDAVLMVLASEHYDEDDYIRDYSEFLRLAKP